MRQAGFAPSTLLLVALVTGGCPTEDTPPIDESPYPDLEVTGTVVDVRGGPVAGAHVVITNAYDSSAADTDSNGEFTLVVDGSDSASSISVSQATYRSWSGTVAIDATSTSAGTMGLISKEEILFSTYGGDNDLYMIRADGAGDLIQITATADRSEVTPRRSDSGHVVRWADTTEGVVYEAAWDGSNPRAVYTLAEGFSLLGIAWGERGTFVARHDQSADRDEIIIAEDPPGTTFDYAWYGNYPDESPPAFGNIGPQPISGNMLCFAGYVPDYQGGGETAYGLFTAFPYFDNSFLKPELIADSDGADLYPRWSSLRSDGSLDLALVRDYQLLISHVTSDDQANYYSTPTPIYGTGDNDINVNRVAWAPEIEGQSSRIAFAVNAFSSGSTLAGPGDIMVLEYDHTTGSVVGEPQVIYDAAAEGNPGLALSIDWR